MKANENTAGSCYMRFRFCLNVVMVLAVITASALLFGTPAFAHGSGSSHTIIVGHNKNRFPIKQPDPPADPPALVNVVNYGAIGDGKTNNQAAIQNAINAAAASGAGVYFPPGTFLYTAPLIFNGMAIQGAGPSSILLSASSSAYVELTGFGPSIQNMQLSTQGASGTTYCLYVTNATSFTVTNNTFTQSSDGYGVYVYFSSIGAVNSNTFNGAGTSTSDYGVELYYAFNCSVNSNVFQNEAVGIYVYEYCEFIAVQYNVVGNVTYPTQSEGIYVYNSPYVTVSGNTIQMANSSTTSSVAIYLYYPISTDVIQNVTYGGYYGIVSYYPYAGNPIIIQQNTIHNTGSSGILHYVYQATTLLNNNFFGECGLFDTTATSNVIDVENPSAYTGTTQIMNNSYQGHANNLQYYVYATTVPSVNISGNTQTQTSLPGNPNN